MSILGKSKQLKKELTLFKIYTIATGSTIASGFFLLPGLAFSSAGPAMVISYLVAAVPVIPAIFCMAELSTAMPRAGGVYFYLDRSMGPLVGTIGGIGTWLALVLKTAFALVGIGAYISLFFPKIQMLPFSIFFALLFGAINFFGAKKTSIFQSVLVVGLLGLLGWFFGLGIFKISFRAVDGFFDAGINPIFATAGLVYVSYVGLSKIASVSEEIKNPDRNIPLAMFLALLTVIVVYTVGTVLMIGIVPAEKLTNDLTPVATTAELLIGHWGAVVMSVAAILAFFSVANAGILSCSRYPLAMSRDHLMPRFLKKLSKNKIPVYSIFVTVFAIVIVLLLFDPSKIAKLAGAFQLLLFSMVSFAVIIMRESKIDSYDPGFRSPLYPWMQFFGIAAPLWLIVEMGWLPSLFAAFLVLTGFLWYRFYARGKVVRDGAIYHIFARYGQRKCEGLDGELRSILKEKGLREQDPFDAVVAEAHYIDASDCPTYEAIVEQSASYLSKKVHIQKEILFKKFMDGTQVGATPVSKGVALPHLRLPGIDFSEMVMVRCRKGIHIEVPSDLFGERVANELIYAVFFLISSDKNATQHLRILAQIASHVDDEDFMKKWLSAKDEQKLKELLMREDRYISLVLKGDEKSVSFIGKQIKELDLPQESLIVLIHRRGGIVLPHGNTVLEMNDRLTIISDPKGIQDLRNIYCGA